MTQPTALDRYMQLTQECDEVLEDLGQFIDDHGEILPEQVDWGYVGNMAHVLSLLKEAQNFIRHGDDEE